MIVEQNHLVKKFILKNICLKIFKQIISISIKFLFKFILIIIKSTHRPIIIKKIMIWRKI